MSTPDPLPTQVADVEALADWLGEQDEARNVFDITDEATTVINIAVEELAQRLITTGWTSPIAAPVEPAEKVLHTATIDGQLAHASMVEGALADVANGVVRHLRSHEERAVTVNVTRTLDGWLREVEAKHVVTLDGRDFNWVHVLKRPDEAWPRMDDEPARVAQETTEALGGAQ